MTSTGNYRSSAHFLFATVAVACIAIGVLPYDALVLWYVIAMFIFLVNSLRTLSAHAYRNPGDQPMEFYEQYLDSIKCSGQFPYRFVGSSRLALSRDASPFYEPALP